MRKLLCVLLTTMLIFVMCGCETSGLENYVTNSDEVTVILQEKFGTDKLTYKNTTSKNDEATLKQFGNGQYSMTVNDIAVVVSCEDHIAMTVFIKTTTAGGEIVRTPTGDEIMRANTPKGVDIVQTEVNGALSGD